MNWQWLYIFLGGGLGSVCRYYLSFWLDTKTTFQFPIGTFVSNMLASLIFGLLAGYFLRSQGQENLTLFLLAGFCGGFSTFSTFSKDNFLLLESGNYLHLGLNIGLSIFIGILFFFIGIALTRPT